MIGVDIIEAVLSTDKRYLDLCNKFEILENTVNEKINDELLDDLEDDIITDLNDDSVLEPTDVVDNMLEKVMDEYYDIINDDDGKIIDTVAEID